MSLRLELEPEDLRGGGGAARRWGMVLVIIVMVMVGSAAGLWAAYQVIGHRSAGGAVPLLRADERPVKVAPANPGGLKVPDQNIYILNDQRPIDSRVEQLLPQPETPLPRPSPAEPAVTDAALQPVVAPAVAAPAAASAPIAAPAAAPAAVPPTPAPAVTPPTPTPAVAAPPAIAAAPPPPARMIQPPAQPASYRVQVGAVRSEAEAAREWQRLQRTEGDVLGRLSVETERVDDGARGVFYRIIAGPFADADAAAHACEALKQRKVGCLLVKP